MHKNQTNRRKGIFSLSLVALLLVSGVTVASEPMMEDLPALIIVDSDVLDIDSVVETIRGLGGTVSHIFPPQVVIGKLSAEAEDHLLQDSDITVYKGPVDVAEYEEWGKETLYALIAWNNNYMGLSVDAGLTEPPVSPEPPPDDTEILPDISSYIVQNSYAGPYGAGVQDTSEYLVGSVAVGVLFLESNGMLDEDTENWTEEEEAQVTSEIQNGLNWLAYQEEDADLSFVYEWHYSVPVGYEPIARPHTDDDLWEQQAMHHLGYGNPHYLVNEYLYANDLRQKYNTDWAFLIFVVDCSEDEDNAFSDGVYAYSFLGGPRMVVTYSNSIWGIANMDSIIAHETCHIFWALDQNCMSEVEQTAVSGYLAAETTNSEWNGESCTPTPPCIMKGEPMYNSQLDVSARTQLGWSDSDSDGVLDVLDTVPEVTMDQQGITCTGTATVSPLPNENPLKEGNPVSLNSITAVEYRVDQEEWKEAEPLDGCFDSPEEKFSFTCSVTTEGEYTVEVRAQNSAGNWSEPATVTITAEGNPYLVSEIAVSPAAVNPQETLLVMMTVENTGEAGAQSVVPVLNAPDTVVQVSGPEPESADIPAGESVAFEWVYRAETTEEDVTVMFSGNATGLTEAGEEISSEEVDSNSIEVRVEPVLNSGITALLYGLIEGDTITVYMEVYNAGEVTLENVTPSEVTVSCTGTASATLLSGPVPEPPMTLKPDTMKKFEWTYVATPGAQGGSAVFSASVSGEAEGEPVTSETAKATVGIKSPAILTTFIIATPKEIAVGGTITVALTIQNIGQADAVNVVFSELSVSGTGKVELESGPSQTSVNVEGRTFEIVHWTYIAVEEGTLTFSSSVQGTDASTGDLLSVPEEQSNPVTITPGSPEETEEPEETEPEEPEETEPEEPEEPEETEPEEPEEPEETEEPEIEPPSNPPPSNFERQRAEKAIRDVRKLLEKAYNLLIQKQTQNRDIQICGRAFAEAQRSLQQAELFFEKGQYKEATNSAIAALLKVYEVLNCLNNM